MAGDPIRPLPPKRSKRTPMPADVVEAVHARSGHRCECSQGCTDRAEVLHHRRLRSQGGRHTVENIAHLSDRHHKWVHDNVAEARARGLLLASWDPITPLALRSAPTPQGGDEK